MKVPAWFRDDGPEVVLVPPLLERDHRGRSRMVKSSYDFQFSKPQLKWLFRDYLWGGASSLLRFSPPEDRRLSVKANFGTSLDAPGADAKGRRSEYYFLPEAANRLNTLSTSNCLCRAQVPYLCAISLKPTNTSTL